MFVLQFFSITMFDEQHQKPSKLILNLSVQAAVYFFSNSNYTGYYREIYLYRLFDLFILEVYSDAYSLIFKIP